jgi:hypothetical protein
MNFAQNHRRRSGFALVIVLCILVLLTVIVVGLLGRATTERVSSASYAASISSRQLADTAVGVVVTQINAATTKGWNVAWTSQPGLIRNYDAAGNLASVYKLYSATELVSTSPGIVDGVSPDAPPAGWAGSPAHWVDLNAPAESNQGKVFPILDPASVSEGFSLTSAPGATAFQPAPMPVRWLYVLQNGEMVAPAAGGTGDSATIAGASTANPVVGRVAFWTDDETCKVNVNTAGEGFHWDTPRANSPAERNLGAFQPAQREFQGYPGHPATTSLSTVFPSLTSAQIDALVPRISGGGSNRGTAVATSPVTLDTDRLYASVDELRFLPDRSDSAGLSKPQIEQSRFFLTAHSRAPETNLFNLPRVATWPVYRLNTSGAPVTARTTPFDRLIAFAASTPSAGGLVPYFFQRENAASPTNDFANIPRNLALYDYLSFLTAEAIPGNAGGGTFLTKYPDDRNQILTGIFDYIRSTNLYDDLLAAGNQFTPGLDGTNPAVGHGQVAPLRHPTNGTMGFGRFYTLSELGLLMICNAAADDPATASVDESLGSNDPVTNTALQGTPLTSGQKRVQAMLLMELFSPMMGYTLIRPDIRIGIQGLDQLTVDDGSGPRNLGLPADTTVDYRDLFYQTYTGSLLGGNPGYRSLVSNRRAPNLDTASAGLYPFVGLPVTITVPASGTIDISSANITVTISAGTATPQLVQTLNLTLPAMSMEVPDLVSVGTAGTSPTTKEFWWLLARKDSNNVFHRFDTLGQSPGNKPSPQRGAVVRSDSDTLKTILPPHGDYRLLAAKPVVAATEFTLHPAATTAKIAASLGTADASSWEQTYDIGGRYISSINTSGRYSPDIPLGSLQTPDATGDFDTGISSYGDGPFINKPDEGTIKRDAKTPPYFYRNWEHQALGPTFFSPNRIIPSPVMFGSLPTGVISGTPWRTLRFRPQPGHTGDVAAVSPRDHLLLDLFWMPVVEPYAISDRFSTAGKINMNYQILPFTYIERSTGLRAVLKNEKMMALPNAAAEATYPQGYKGPSNTEDFRLGINLDETLKQFADRFRNGGSFVSASEICDLHIVPAGQTLSAMPGFWDARRLTGDNVRERIYATLYPRLTTRSNTYTVHMRVQALKKRAGSDPVVWEDGRDLITSEFRGSRTLERFINPNDRDIPDYAQSPSDIPNLRTLDHFYKWRTVANRQFGF